MTMFDLKDEYWEFENLILSHPLIPSEVKNKFKIMIDSHRISYVKCWEIPFDIKEKQIINILVKLQLENQGHPNKDELAKIIGSTYYNNVEYKHQNITSQLIKLQKKGIIKRVKGRGNEKLILLQNSELTKSLKKSVAWIFNRKEYLKYLLKECGKYSNEIASQFNTNSRISDEFQSTPSSCSLYRIGLCTGKTCALQDALQDHINKGIQFIANTNFIFQAELEKFLEYQIEFLDTKGINSDHPEIWFQLGKRFEQEQEKINAFKAYDKAKSLDPNNDDILEHYLRLKGEIHLDSSEIKKAINCLRRAINLSTHYHILDELAMCKCNLGKIAKKIGRSAEAYEEFHESAELFKKSYKIYNEPRFLKSIRKMFFEIEEPDKAISYFKELFEKSPNNVDFLLELICTYCWRENYKKVNGLIKKACKHKILLKKLKSLNCTLISQNS